MSDTTELMNRRQALVRAAFLMGGALSASTVAGVLAGCEVPGKADGAGTWVPRTLSPDQGEMVLTMGEHILPETDTPGARAARVHEYIDAMLTDYYSPEQRQRFLAGLERAEAYARRVFGTSYLQASPEQQLQLSLTLNREAFREGARSANGALPPANPALSEGEVDRGDEHVLPTPEGGWDPDDVGRGSFFRTLKELVLVGYYSSEVGATRELEVNPMGSWRADIPYEEVGHAWA